MFRKPTLLALAATAALSLAILNPDLASARGFGGHGGGHGGIGMHSGGHGGFARHGGFRHVGHVRYHRHHWHRHYVRWHRPIWYTTPVAYGIARPAVAGPCTCLTKEYTPEGAVLFKDRCTNEAAINPPAVGPGPAAEVGPQQQPQAAYVPQYPPQAIVK